MYAVALPLGVIYSYLGVLASIGLRMGKSWPQICTHIEMSFIGRAHIRFSSPYLEVSNTISALFIDLISLCFSLPFSVPDSIFGF